MANYQKVNRTFVPVYYYRQQRVSLYSFYADGSKIFPLQFIMTQDSASAIEVPPTIGDEAAILVSNVNSGLHAKVTPRT